MLLKNPSNTEKQKDESREKQSNFTTYKLLFLSLTEHQLYLSSYVQMSDYYLVRSNEELFHKCYIETYLFNLILS